MALGTKASTISDGSDRDDERGVLGLWLRSALLRDMHRGLCAEVGVDPENPFVTVPDLGQAERELGRLAAGYHADDLAQAYYRAGAAKARPPYGLGIVNGLAGLLDIFRREAESTAADLAALLSDAKLAPDAAISAHLSVAGWLAQRDRPAAIEHLREAAAIVEQASLPHLRGRVYSQLHDQLAAAGDDIGAFEALQQVRARELLDILSAQTAEPAAYRPPDLAKARSLLGSADASSAFVDVVIRDDGLRVYVVNTEGLRSFTVPAPPPVLAEVTRAMWGDVTKRAADAVRIASTSPLFRGLAEHVVQLLGEGHPILLAVDDALANFPMHVAPVGGRPWGDVMPVGRLPAIGLLEFRRPVLAATAPSLVAGDSGGELRGAARECLHIAQKLNTSAIVGAACTVSAIEDRLKHGHLAVVHIAVHGRADVRHGGQASLRFADGSGSTQWVLFDQIAALPWDCNLLVFSGCSTAVGGPRDGSGLYGVAQAAAQAGAATVIASLWPVGDESAATFMTSFYDELARVRDSRAATADLRLVLATARAAIGGTATTTARRDGRDLDPDDEVDNTLSPDLAKMLDWAAFTILGNPIVTFAA